MASMIRETASTDSHLNSARRHQRLCRQVKGAEKYSEAIQPQMDELKAKREETKSKVDNKQDAYDDMILADLNLDNRVRTLHESSKQYDRDNPGANVLIQIFPDGNFSHIVKTSRTKEPDVVEKLAVRVENLGENHVLYPLAQQLRTDIEASHAAIVRFAAAIREQKITEAEEEIAQVHLRRQYEANYLDARKELGRAAADRLFPRIIRHETAEEDELEEVAA